MITAMEFGPNLLVVQKIPLFDENVYILYAVKMVRDLMFLLFIETIGSRKFFSIPDITSNKIEMMAIITYGK